MDAKTFNKELGDFDLLVGNWTCYELDEGIGYWIENIGDPTVGIFVNVLTPTFNTLDELYAYWQSHKNEIVGEE
jgi:hypothetical protein